MSLKRNFNGQSGREWPCQTSENRCGTQQGQVRLGAQPSRSGFDRTGTKHQNRNRKWQNQ
jgi:hypothetical protein